MKYQRSLLLRLLAVVAIMILAPSLLTFLVFFRTIPAKMEAQAKANADFYIDQTAASVKGSMELARDLAFSAIADASLRESMQKTNQYLVSSGRGALERVVGSVAAYQSSWNRHALETVYLFRRDGQFVFYSPKGSYVQQQRRMQRIWQETEALTSARTLFRVAGAAEGKAYFLLDYKNIDNLDLLGKLMMELDVKTLVNAGDLAALYPGTCLALTGADGQTLYSQGEDLDVLLGNAGDGESVSEFLQGGGSGRQHRYYHVRCPIENCQLRLDFFIPVVAIYNQVWETSQLFLTFCVLILLLTTGIAAIGYCLLLKPLRSMEDTLGRLASSNYTARMPKSGYRELAALEETFNAMADNLDSSFQDAYQKGIQLQESESRLLAAQINPHFVFNVLETINMRCVDAGMKDLSRMVTDLAQLLRGNIGVGGGSQKITFAQELNYVRYYMDLQQGRFGESLRCSVDYEDEEILQYLLPRLSIQPLVENAIVHGLEPRRGLGSVSVRLWEEDSSVCVRVEDDGVGFDPSQVDLSDGADCGGRHNHIALPNILRRLRLLYGDRAGLDIRSSPGRGTTVLLMLPIDEKEV
ncbi:sensor histidine kinase [Dysosmobacter sp.]